MVRVNTAVLEAVLATAQALAPRIEAAPPSLDGLLALKGVMEVGEAEEREEERRAAEKAVDRRASPASSLRSRRCAAAKAWRSDGSWRRGSSEIAALAQRAELAPGRRPEAIQAAPRRAGRGAPGAVRTLRCGPAASGSDPDRGKADVREELDRLAAHVAQAQHLIGQGGPIGRRLDFLAQELNREANTLCAKASDVELTNIGLELKAAVEQFREQVQNVE